MVQINFAQKSVTVKIVYYGPGMSGKTTNLEIVHQRAPESNKGDLTSISTDGDRTLFFDFMPLDLGTVAGMRTQFQIYTVPGQVYYNSTRKLVLQGVDGVIFVADSSASMVEENLESLRNLEENLAEYGKNIDEIPLIIQYNKRDLPDALPVAELEASMNRWGAPNFEAVANTGQGVFPTLKALAARVLDTIHEQTGGGGRGAAAGQRQAAAQRPQSSAPPSAPAAPNAQAPAAPRGPLPAQPQIALPAFAEAPMAPAFPAAPPAQPAPRQPAPQAPKPSKGTGVPAHAATPFAPAPTAPRAAQPRAPQPTAPQASAPQPMAPQPMAPQPMAPSAAPRPTAAPVAPLSLGQTQSGLRLAETGIRPNPAPASRAAGHGHAPQHAAPAHVAPAPAPSSSGAARLRPRAAAAPAPNSKNKSTLVTVVIVVVALIAGIAIGGSVFKLL